MGKESILIPASEIEEMKAEIWYAGINMTGDYQGVWIRFKDIESIIDAVIKMHEVNEVKDE